MDENSLNRVTSRRDFLKKSLKTVGYSIPVMMAFSSVALNAWADKYTFTGNGIAYGRGNRRGRGKGRGRGRSRGRGNNKP